MLLPRRRLMVNADRAALGESRAAFALIELDAALRHPDVTDATLDPVIAHTVEDRTATLLVEHLEPVHSLT